MVGLERKLGHQLRPAIHVVGFVRRLHQVLGEVDHLLGVGLHAGRIDAAGRGEGQVLDASPLGFAEHHGVQSQVGRAGGLVGADEAASAVCGRKMEDDVHAGNGAGRSARIKQVGLDELDAPAQHGGVDVLADAAREVIDHPHPSAPRHQGLDQMRPDERASARHQYLFRPPIQGSSPVSAGALAVPAIAHAAEAHDKV